MNTIRQITLRQVAIEDAATILRLLRGAFDEYEGVLDPPSGAHQETIESVRRNIATGAVMALVGDQPAGFAFYKPRDGLLYFGRLSVLPQFRNRGVGTALLEHVERTAKDTGAHGVSLGVRVQLPHLLERYQRLGYRVTKQMTHEGYTRPTWLYLEKRF